MKIEILLPTEYIDKNGGLSILPSDILTDVKEKLVKLILKYEAGVMESLIKGYYKSNRGIVTYSNYIVLTVYTENLKIKEELYTCLSGICKILMQESIGVIVDNVFHNIQGFS